MSLMQCRGILALHQFRSVTGICRGPRTVPADHLTTAPALKMKSGNWPSHSSSAMRISMRAKFEPMQR
jgi:hypothetical protein